MPSLEVVPTTVLVDCEYSADYFFFALTVASLLVLPIAFPFLAEKWHSLLYIFNLKL